MRTKVFLILSFALTCHAWQPFVLAQEAVTIYSIGYLTLASKPDNEASTFFQSAEMTDLLLRELRKAGYEEGKNLKFERRYADGEVDRLPVLAAELVELKPDLIITVSTPATQAAQKVTSEVPIVFMMGSDPVKGGFVASMGRPGGNITGFNWVTPSAVKQLQWLQEIVPGLKTVATVCPTSEIERCIPYVEWLEKQVSDQGLVFLVHDVAQPEDFDAMFAAARHDGAEAVLIMDMYWFYSFCEKLGQAAARSPLPAVFACQQFVEAGGLVAYEAEETQGATRTAAIVSRILDGTNPGEIPVERPTKYELLLNLKTARTWGIELPETLLLQATRVVE